MSNKILNSIVERVFKGTSNGFRIRITNIDYNDLKIFDKISEMVRQGVLDIVAEGVYVSTFLLFTKLRYLHIEIYVFEDTIQVQHTLITY